jgi:ribonuclease inhibitor
MVIIDSKEFSNVDELHLVLKEKLQLPDYYGKNLDALWDCLTGWIDLPITIEWIGYESSKQKIGEYAEKLLHTFQEAEQEIDGFRFNFK